MYILIRVTGDNDDEVDGSGGDRIFNQRPMRSSNNGIGIVVISMSTAPRRLRITNDLVDKQRKSVLKNGMLYI